MRPVEEVPVAAAVFGAEIGGKGLVVGIECGSVGVDDAVDLCNVEVAAVALEVLGALRTYI